MEAKERKIFSYINENKLDIEKVVKDFSNYVQTIIRNSYISSSEDAEEIALDVFFTLWKNQEKLDINKNMSAYIMGITKNLIKKKYRNIKQSENIDNYEEKLVSSSNIELCFIEKESQSNILNEVEKFKKIDKEIFLKYYYEEKSILEIAEFYGISESKVKSRLFRIRKKLKKLLKERGY